MAEDNTGKLAWFFAGAAIGASIALLYAPSEGEAMRSKIDRRLRRQGRQLLDRGRQLMDRGCEVAENVAEEAAEVMESGRKLVQG